MMNRILKRPMFRMGGRSDDGIMSLRKKYEEGGDVGILTRIADFISPTSGTILERIQRRQTDPSIGEVLFSPSKAPIEFRTEEQAQKFLEANPNFYSPITILSTGRTLNLMGSAQASETDQTEKPKITKKNTGDSDTKTQELSDSDLKTMYEDLLPLFKSELSADEDELRRQKYLELAKFGANILAQPGGDLVGTIGKAAAPSIEGLTRVAETKRRANAAAKSLALEAALRQADPGTIMKQVRDIMRLDPSLTQKEALAKVLSTGSATREATAQGRIDDYAKDLYDDEIVGSKTAARVAAENIEKSGLGLGSFQKLPDSQDELVEGEYYIKKDGSIRRFDGEKLLTPSDEGFK